MRQTARTLVSPWITLALLFTPVALARCTEADITGIAHHLPASDSGPAVFGSTWAAQAFTAPGTECSAVREITFRLKKAGQPDDLVVEIYDHPTSPPRMSIPTGLGGTATVRGSATLAASLVSSGEYLDRTMIFAKPVELAAGKRYIVVLHQAGGTAKDYYRLGLTEGNPYAGGEYCRWNGSAWDCSSNADVRMAICSVSCESSATKPAPAVLSTVR